MQVTIVLADSSKGLHIEASTKPNGTTDGATESLVALVASRFIKDIEELKRLGALSVVVK